ncbi:hypothetical protein HAX54_006247, partial [Datura stramonium]|nr:hypothetical protein [Datura stramonium]
AIVLRQFARNEKWMRHLAIFDRKGEVWRLWKIEVKGGAVVAINMSEEGDVMFGWIFRWCANGEERGRGRREEYERAMQVVIEKRKTAGSSGGKRGEGRRGRRKRRREYEATPALMQLGGRGRKERGREAEAGVVVCRRWNRFFKGEEKGIGGRVRAVSPSMWFPRQNRESGRRGEEKGKRAVFGGLDDYTQVHVVEQVVNGSSKPTIDPTGTGLR